MKLTQHKAPPPTRTLRDRAGSSSRRDEPAAQRAFRLQRVNVAPPRRLHLCAQRGTGENASMRTTKSRPLHHGVAAGVRARAPAMRSAVTPRTAASSASAASARACARKRLTPSPHPHTRRGVHTSAAAAQSAAAASARTDASASDAACAAGHIACGAIRQTRGNRKSARTARPPTARDGGTSCASVARLRATSSRSAATSAACAVAARPRTVRERFLTQRCTARGVGVRAGAPAAPTERVPQPSCSSARRTREAPRRCAPRATPIMPPHTQRPKRINLSCSRERRRTWRTSSSFARRASA